MGLAGPVRQVRAIVTIIDRQDLRTNSGSFATLAAILRGWACDLEATLLEYLVVIEI